MRKNARLLLVLIGLSAAASTLTACNTTQGAGEDLSAAGRGISNSAEKNNGYGK